VIVRADSAYYNHDVIAAAIQAGARFSVTARTDPAVRRAITAIEEAAWIPIHYPNAVWDAEEGRLVSDAEVAEIQFTAFISRRKDEQIDGRLIVRRVKRLNPPASRPGSTPCSRPTGTTQCSPTHPCRCSTRKRATVSTRSSNKSTPTIRAVRWHICPQDPSPQTQHGSCSRQSRSTSPAPPAPWPRPGTPAPPSAAT
jgi:hypothetical protein